MKKWICGLAVAAMVAGGFVLVGQVNADDKKEKEYTIKEVMQQAHKAPKRGEDSMLQEIVKGSAEKADIDKLVAMYESIEKASPPKGDKAEWKTAVTKLLKAAKDVQAGKTGAARQLRAAANCMACHEKFRGK